MKSITYKTFCNIVASVKMTHITSEPRSLNGAAASADRGEAQSGAEWRVSKTGPAPTDLAHQGWLERYPLALPVRLEVRCISISTASLFLRRFALRSTSSAFAGGSAIFAPAVRRARKVLEFGEPNRRRGAKSKQIYPLRESRQDTINLRSFSLQP